MPRRPCWREKWVNGWMYNGHDTFNPESIPILDLRDERALVDTMDKVHSFAEAITPR